MTTPKPDDTKTKKTRKPLTKWTAGAAIEKIHGQLTDEDRISVMLALGQEGRRQKDIPLGNA